MCTQSHRLRILDILYSLVICTPLSILFWSGTWKIMDLYIYPNIITISSWISFAVGGFVATANYFLASLLGKFVTVECALQHVILSRTLIYINALGHLNYWRGVWNLCDNLTGKGLLASLLSFILSHFILVLLRASGTCLFQPFSVTIDSRENFYETKPRFNTKVNCNLMYLIHSALITLFEKMCYTTFVHFF